MLSWTVFKIDFAIIILTTLKKIEVQHRGRAEQSDQIPFEEHVLQGRWTSAQAFRQTWSKGSQRNLLQLVRLLCGQIHALWIVKLMSPRCQHHQTVLQQPVQGVCQEGLKGFLASPPDTASGELSRIHLLWANFTSGCCDVQIHRDVCWIHAVVCAGKVAVAASCEVHQGTKAFRVRLHFGQTEGNAAGMLKLALNQWAEPTAKPALFFPLFHFEWFLPLFGLLSCSGRIMALPFPFGRDSVLVLRGQRFIIFPCRKLLQIVPCLKLWALLLQRGCVITWSCWVKQHVFSFLFIGDNRPSEQSLKSLSGLFNVLVDTGGFTGELVGGALPSFTLFLLTRDGLGRLKDVLQGCWASIKDTSCNRQHAQKLLGKFLFLW